MKNGILVLIALLIIGGGVYLVTNSSEEESPQASSGESAIIDGGDSHDDSGTPDTTYSLSDVATHSSEDDCWTIVSDHVYDITSYIPRHPGGDEILRACGTDGTSLFTQRTTTDGEQVGSGRAHSDNASSALDTLLQGHLAE